MERLLEVMQLRVLAKLVHITAIEVTHQSAIVTLGPKAAIPEPAVHAMMDRLKKRLRFLSPHAFEIQMPHDDWGSTFTELNTTLQSLGHCDTNKSTIQPKSSA